jgi:hypothetical protein
MIKVSSTAQERVTFVMVRPVSGYWLAIACASQSIAIFHNIRGSYSVNSSQTIMSMSLDRQEKGWFAVR